MGPRRPKPCACVCAALRCAALAVCLLLLLLLLLRPRKEKNDDIFAYDFRASEKRTLQFSTEYSERYWA